MRPFSTSMRNIIIFTGIALAFPMFYAAIFFLASLPRIPYLPDFSVTSVSTTFRNVVDENRIRADLDVSFLVENKAEKGMVFDHLVASVTQRYKLNSYHTKAGTHLDPFELGGNREFFKETIPFSLKNVTLGFHAWEKNSSGFSFSYVGFALTGHATYKGKVWPKQRIPIHVWCEPVKVPLSSNATSETKTVNLAVNCGADGLWHHLHVPFLSSAILLLFLSSLISFGSCVFCQGN